MKSRSFSKSVLSFVAVLVVGLVGLMAVRNSTVMAALTGAIYTTDPACSGVNINIYASKDDVNLNGGPQGGG